MKNKKIWFILLVLVLLAGAGRIYKHSFTPEKWRNDPENRTDIVDDLLADYTLIGMGEEELRALLGTDNSDQGYFVEAGRYVYWMGPERGLISIDSEWLCVEMKDGKVANYFITTD